MAVYSMESDSVKKRLIAAFGSVVCRGTDRNGFTTSYGTIYGIGRASSN
jgi:hypothetical protein